jgi:GT2 family glycosyltransferase
LTANQDTVFSQNAIQNLLKQSDLFPGSLLFPIVKGWEFTPTPAWYMEKYLGGVDIDGTSQGSEVLEHQSAVCFFGKARVFQTAGYFDPTYFMYHEDDDYFNRFKKKGGSLVLVKSAIVAHYFEKTSVEEGQRESHLWYRNARIRHFARYKSVSQFWKAWLRTTMGSIIKLRIGRLYHGMQHDLSIWQNLSYVRDADERRIEKAAHEHIIEDLLSD